ncbi:Putative transposase of IS4/5 family [Nitrosomonas eutropha]|uniref:Putative transposase of IS4/5 family n=1 Tax=Nitrosomonas eutropha TaxID=916 RepID=A0A1I7F4Z4_9PROT|nr:Putative transposase of IS4/5 family [Nitrosomonas eutropha]
MKRPKSASDISREKFAEIEPLLRTGCQWRYLPDKFPKWQSVYAYWRKWSEPDQNGVSLLERRPREVGAQRLQHVPDRGHAKREEHGHSEPEGL